MKKMDKKGSDNVSDWSHEMTRGEVLHQLSQEALRIASEAMPITSPRSPDDSFGITEVSPRDGHTCIEEASSFHLHSSNSSNLHKWKSHMQRALNLGTHSFRENHSSSTHPEILLNQKRQWYQLKSQTMDPEKYKEPTVLFEHFVVVGLHPNANLEVVEDAFIKRKKWEHEMQKNEVLDCNIRSQPPILPALDAEVLFQYPPGKKLNLHLKDLSSFCFPEGVKTHIVERTTSLSELNELVYGQGHLHRDDLSFIFSLKVADNASLYGVCLHVQEVVQKPPIFSGVSQSQSRCSRFLISAPRCYCILTRVPFFKVHYEMLNSIIAQERINRITKLVNEMAVVDSALSHCLPRNHIHANIDSLGDGTATSWVPATPDIISDEDPSSRWEQHSSGSDVSGMSNDSQVKEFEKKDDKNLQGFDESTSATLGCQTNNCHTPDVSPYVYQRNQQLEFQSFESLFSPTRSMLLEGENYLFNNNDEEFRDDMIMKWAKENKNDMLQIICGYHHVHLPERGSKLIFQPLEHLPAIEYQRPSISTLGLDEMYTDVKPKSSEEASQVKLKLAAAEETVTLSLWATATICRVLSLESILALVTGVLLEKQLIVQCPNLGVLSAVVLSLNPIIRPFEWQSLFLPILPGKMLEFVDAPVPFIVGVQYKPTDLKTKASNLVHVNVLENKVKTCTLPPLPRRKELISQLHPIHSKLSWQDPLAQKHPVYKCNEIQAEAATEFLCVMRCYLESLCEGLQLHSITSVQNNFKVALLLKDSFIESFPPGDQPFIKLLVETQLFTALSDSRLSSYENE